MRDVVSTMPCHMFDVAKTSAPTASEAGWHIAHVFDVKNRDTDWPNWNRREVIARFIRNIHPANHFLLPKTDWQRWGADTRVIGYFAALYRDRYAEIWNEFVALSGGNVDSLEWITGDIQYSYGSDAAPTIVASTSSPARVPTERASVSPPQPRGRVSPAAVEYRAHRLLFKRTVIEQLGENEAFRVVTPLGAFQMTKAQFYQTFANVVASASYQVGGVYHYQTPPRRAEEFRVEQ